MALPDHHEAGTEWYAEATIVRAASPLGLGRLRSGELRGEVEGELDGESRGEEGGRSCRAVRARCMRSEAPESLPEGS